MRKKINILTIIIFTIFFIVGCNNNVKAASASISANKISITVGETVKITTTINGAGWDINLSGAISQGYADTTDDAENGTKTYTYFFTPTEAGTYTIKLSGNVSDSNEKRTSVSGEVTINVAKSTSGNTSNNDNTGTSTNTTTATTTTKSSNANLSNLGITPNDFKGFKSGTTAYNVTVPNDVAQVTVYAKLQDSKAKLTGTGVQKLNVGKNTLNVVVTAEDGTKKTYTINVTREEAKSNTVENNTTSEETSKEEKSESQNEEKTSNSDLIKLEITGHKLTPEFSPDIYEYTLDVNGDISSLAVVAEGANHNVSVEVVGNTDLADGENTITVLVYNGETKKNSTYQIIVNKTNIDIEGLNTTLNDAIKKANKIRSILFGILIFIIVCIIIFIIVKHKYKVNSEHENDYEYDEEDKEKLNLDEEEEFFKRLNKEKIKEPEEEKVSTVAVANSIIEENKTDSKLSNEVKENDEEEDTTEEFFKTSKFKKKGKHF